MCGIQLAGSIPLGVAWLFEYSFDYHFIFIIMNE